MALTDDFEKLGPNSGLVEEMYRQYLDNPESVSESWRDFFADYAPRGAGAPPAPPPAPAPAAPAPAPAAPTPPPAAPGAPVAKPTGPSGPPIMDGETAAPLRGSAARIVENMEASLGVPTATSVRTVAAAARGQPADLSIIEPGRHGKVIHAPHRVRAHEGGREGARDELGLRAPGRQAGRGPPRPPEPRDRGGRGATRRDAFAARPEHQACRRVGLRHVLLGVRRADPQGAHEQARPRTRRDMATITSPDDGRSIGTTALPGQGIIGIGTISTRPSTRRGPADHRPPRGEQGLHPHQHLRPPDHRWRRER